MRSLDVPDLRSGFVNLSDAAIVHSNVTDDFVRAHLENVAKPSKITVVCV